MNHIKATVKKITEQVKAFPESELDEFLSWLADYEMGHSDEWDKEIERDSQKDALTKRMPCCNGGDIPTIRDSVRRLIFGRCLVMRTRNESVEERNANDDTEFQYWCPFRLRPH